MVAIGVPSYVATLTFPPYSGPEGEVGPDLANYNACVEILELADGAGMLTEDLAEDLEAYGANCPAAESVLEHTTKRYPEEIIANHADDMYPDEFSVTMHIQEWVIRARGEAHDLRVAGYCLPDGRLVHMSHGGGKRDVDHREIHWPGSWRLGGGHQNMRYFMESGAMRMSGNNTCSLELCTRPTRSQMRIIGEAADAVTDAAHLDFHDGDRHESAVAFSGWEARSAAAKFYGVAPG